MMQRAFYILWVCLLFQGCHPDTSSPCPPFSNVPNSPYDNPIWHPSGEIIGFNHVPIKEVRYTNGMECVLQAEYIFETDSIGFWLINEDGTDQRRVMPYALLSPSWSPDGDWIAFSRGAQIFKMPFDGQSFDTTHIEQLTHEGRNFFPTWSPDGAWIAFDSSKDNPTGSKAIWKMRSDGTSARRIAYQPEEGEIRSPFWGSNFHIVHYRYLASSGSDSPEIFEMDSAGGNVRRITHNDQRKTWPQYTDGEQHIAYVAQVGSTGLQIVVTDREGSFFSQLTMSGATLFSFSKDGRMVYVNFNYDGIDEEKGTLWVMDQQGDHVRQLTFNHRLGNN